MESLDFHIYAKLESYFQFMAQKFDLIQRYLIPIYIMSTNKVLFMSRIQHINN